MTNHMITPGDPFESASELRGRHAGLLEMFDTTLGNEVSEQKEQTALLSMHKDILSFLARATATGLMIEDRKNRISCQALLDYWSTSLVRAGKQVHGVRLQKFDSAHLPDLSDKPSPYMGLEAFRDETFFFGRDQETNALVSQIKRCAMVVVTGASGSGKSSLVLGGAIPRLLNTTACTLIFPTWTPGDTPLSNLAKAVSTVAGYSNVQPTAFMNNPNYLTESLASLNYHDDKNSNVRSSNKRNSDDLVVIVIDQFEEVFTLCDVDTRMALAENLATLLKSTNCYRLVVTVREEFKSQLATLSPFDSFSHNYWFTMSPMGYKQLHKTVTGPAAIVNLQFQDGVVDDLVKKVLGQPAALPLLQFALRQLWEKRDRNRITWEVYTAVGDPLRALRTSCDAFYDGLVQETKDEVKRILLALVRVDTLLEAYRQPIRRSQLLAGGKANTKDVLARLVEKEYVSVISDNSETDPIVEIRHESLIRNWPLLINWIDGKRMEQKMRLVLSQTAERWDREGRPKEGLLSEWQLENASRYTNLGPLETAFVNASKNGVITAAQTRKQRRRKVATALLLVVGVGWGVALFITTDRIAQKDEELGEMEKKLEKQIKQFNSQKIVFNAKVNDLKNKRKKIMADTRAKYEQNLSTLKDRTNELALETQKVFLKNLVASIRYKIGPVSMSSAKDKTKFILVARSEQQKDTLKELSEMLNNETTETKVVDAFGQTKASSEKTVIEYSRNSKSQNAWKLDRELRRYLKIPEEKRVIKNLPPADVDNTPKVRYRITFAPGALDNFLRTHLATSGDYSP